MRENTELRQAMMQVAGSAAIAGIIMVLLGFWFFRDLVGTSESSVYNISITAFLLTIRVGGVALLVVAALEYMGVGLALVIDAFLTGLAGILLLATAIVWGLNGDIDGLFLLIFAVILLRAAMSGWRLFRSPVLAPAEAGEAPDSDGQVQPNRLENTQNLAVSLRSARKRTDERVAMPNSDEPEPEGFLADLGRSSEDDKSK